MDARSARDSDVIAADFFASEEAARAWEASRGAIPETLRDAKRRADKQVAHLTTGRFAGTSPEKAWRLQPILAALFPVLASFAKSADPSRLHPDILKRLEPSAD